jgi:hypothetical protein
MRTAEIAENVPVVSIDSDTLDAARTVAEHRLPGIVVTDPWESRTALKP